MFVEEIAKEVLSHHDKVGGGLGCNTKHKRNTQPNTEHGGGGDQLHTYYIYEYRTTPYDT